ncbi:ribosome recycling factor [Thalassospira xiamenensis]|uniref:ribosome recycling factor n=2 Tax=Thalassospira TaxID=168934 RepID=UPI000A1E9920|nr:ribosome recycling factor [Thalassospira sp. MCCC 1A03138]OSQ31058.1 ribosome-recycling factor [Thalassospira sp. MCCC 1A03138]
MSDVAGLKKDLARRMEGAVEVLHKEFTGLRTGRASASLLEPVMVEAYGVPTPLNQVASVSVPESRMLSVQVWDKSMVKSVEKAIRDSGLGLNPAADGTLVRVPIPALNEERRAELSKVAGKYAEQAKISVRNVRRDGIDQIKKWEKDSVISKDDLHNEEKEIQKLTDKVIGEIDEVLAHKEQEIMQV